MAAIQKSQTINAGEGVEKRETSYTVGGNAKLYRQSGKQFGSFSKLNMQLPYDRYSNDTLGNLPREMKIYVHTKTFTGMFITVLLLTVKKWK